MRIFTVGHSNHASEAFVALLRTHGVTAIADVRSAPYSRFNPWFNRETLAEALEAHGVRYVFLGRELGARPDDAACFEDGRVRYDRLAGTARFRSGLDRAVEGARRYRLALMCAEKDPVDCHRTILVARELVRRGIDVAHILADGRIEPHDDTVERLLARHRLAEPDLFASRAERIERAYDAQAERIAWVDEDAGGRTREGGRHPAGRDPIQRVDEEGGRTRDPIQRVDEDAGGRMREVRPCD